MSSSQANKNTKTPSNPTTSNQTSNPASNQTRETVVDYAAHGKQRDYLTEIIEKSIKYIEKWTDHPERDMPAPSRQFYMLLSQHPDLWQRYAEEVAPEMHHMQVRHKAWKSARAEEEASKPKQQRAPKTQQQQAPDTQQQQPQQRQQPSTAVSSADFPTLPHQEITNKDQVIAVKDQEIKFKDQIIADQDLKIKKNGLRTTSEL